MRFWIQFSRFAANKALEATPPPVQSCLRVDSDGIFAPARRRRVLCLSSWSF
jgi:hypothetical protein